MVLPLPNIFNGVSNQITNKLEKQQNQENMTKKITSPSEKHAPGLELEKALTFYLSMLSVKTLISGTVFPYRNTLLIFTASVQVLRQNFQT